MNELYKKTIELLENTEKPMSLISEKTDVGLRWLYDLKSGRFSDPGVNKIQRIHDYLQQDVLTDELHVKHENSVGRRIGDRRHR